MLVLSRKVGEAVVLEWCGVEVRLMVGSVGSGRTKLLFDAPKGVKIVREEIIKQPMSPETVDTIYGPVIVGGEG